MIDSVRLFLVLWLALISAPVSAQLASRPIDEWIKTLDGEARVSSLRIDEVVAALKLQPGQVVADIGAGTGLLDVPLARAVGPKGIAYAVEIDAGFFPEIKKRADAAGVTNIRTVLGKFTDPALPVTNVDLALFHDVLHHVQGRAEYLKTLARYLAPGGRVAVVDFEGGKGPHVKQPELEVTREQLNGWMKAAGLTQVEDIKMFSEKYFLVFARTPAYTEADVKFMQGMIGHHAQALEMTALLRTRTTREDMKLLGLRIDVSQKDEIKMMQQWLKDRHQGIPDEHAHHTPGVKLMPGMLSADEMTRLGEAKGQEFDRLFLEFMIKHHEGALVMVKELFASAGAGQDADIFAFASDVLADQSMEIDRMRGMLEVKR
jgi:uncharacterized protein (DUF305 family)